MSFDEAGAVGDEVFAQGVFLKGAHLREVGLGFEIQIARLNAFRDLVTAGVLVIVCFQFGLGGIYFRLKTCVIDAGGTEGKAGLVTLRLQARVVINDVARAGERLRDLFDAVVFLEDADEDAFREEGVGLDGINETGEAVAVEFPGRVAEEWFFLQVAADLLLGRGGNTNCFGEMEEGDAGEHLVAELLLVVAVQLIEFIAQ